MSVVLQQNPSPKDNSWRFHGIVTPQLRKDSNTVKHLTFTHEAITLRSNTLPRNRAVGSEHPDNLVLVSFQGLRFPEEPFSVTVTYMNNFFKHGLFLNNVQYRFYGHSNSQLRSKSCFLKRATTDEEIDRCINAMGNFQDIKGAAKRSKRIGLMFSSAEADFDLNPKLVEDIDDLEEGDTLYSDGCGLISGALLRQLAKSKRLVFRGKRHTPHVIQIRYRGYKGVLMYHPLLDKRCDPQKKVFVQFRKSMKKFTATSDNTFSVVGYSVPYAYGRLNNDIIVLLASLGVPEETLMQKQQEYFDWICAASTDLHKAIELLLARGDIAAAEDLFLDGLDSASNLKAVMSAQMAEIGGLKKLGTEVQKSRILVHKSRRLYGVCDPFGVLSEREVHVKVCTGRSGAVTLNGMDIIVVRNPCLHPGDILKLRAVYHPELEHLEECIVFAAAGKHAAPSLSSGGDLDGDQFFVCWDSDLIPKTIAESYTYPAVKKIDPVPVTRERLWQHFSEYNGFSMAKTASLHAKWTRASKDGAMSSQCQELNALYSHAVDGARIKIPDRLLRPPELSEGGAVFILEQMLDASKKFGTEVIPEIRGIQALASTSMDRETARRLIHLMMSSNKMPLSEFQLLRLVLNLAAKYRIEIAEYLPQFNFGALKHSEKTILDSYLNLDPKLHPYVWNRWEVVTSAICDALLVFLQLSLLSSDVVKESELASRRLQFPLQLQRIYSSRGSGLQDFFRYLKYACEGYGRKVIVLSMEPRLRIGIFIRGLIPWDDSDPKILDSPGYEVGGNVVVTAFMPGDSSSRAPFKSCPKGYELSYNDTTFQLFERKRGDTFIQIKRSDAHVVGASIALQKFGQHVAQQIGRVNKDPIHDIEIHVTSSRDRESERIFDLYFDHVETEDILKRIPRILNKFEKNELEAVNWDNENPYFRDIFLNSASSQVLIGQLGSAEILDVLSFAEMYHQEKILFWSFDALLTVTQEESGSSDNIAEWLTRQSELGYVITKRYLRDYSQLPDFLQPVAYGVIASIIQSANKLPSACAVGLSKLSEPIRNLDLRQYQALLRLTVLSVRSYISATVLSSAGGRNAPEYHSTQSHDDRDGTRDTLFTLHVLRSDGQDLSDSLTYGHRHLLAVSLDQAGEARQNCPCDGEGDIAKTSSQVGPVRCRLRPHAGRQVKADFRIDSDNIEPIQLWDHVRVQSASPPTKGTSARCVLDAVVKQAMRGELLLELQQSPPPEYEQMDWKIYRAGNVSTADAMWHAIVRLCTEETDSCIFSSVILGSSNDAAVEGGEADVIADFDDPRLNASQQAAVVRSRDHALTLIWGPPGTGKTTVIERILADCISSRNGSKVLMAASTHNAVDNVLRRFLRLNSIEHILPEDSILRVATSQDKVNEDLRRFTVDGRVGGVVNENERLKKKAEKRVQEAILVFTTCTGAGLGLLRNVDFQTVLIDEASQITEPMSLIPLVKGCRKAILVGDHVQLRPTVSQLGKEVGYEVSLLERLYQAPTPPQIVSKQMLNVQYRFTDVLGRFPSMEFYGGRLTSGITDISDHNRPLEACNFEWPREAGETFPCIFVQCSSEESFGRRSKSNQGQVEIIQRLIAMLKTRSTTHDDDTTPLPSVSIITAYSEQKRMLAKVVSGVACSTIDGFQGREDDIIIYSTVRCNAKGELGFLEDPRRLNVAWTRARLALFVIGDKLTLCGHPNRRGIGCATQREAERDTANKMWSRAIAGCRLVQL